MTEEEIERLPSLGWMPSRIPIRDALVTVVSNDSAEFPKELIPASYEQRWYPQDDGSLRLLVPNMGQPFDPTLFHIETAAWDHTTCDFCVTRVPPMTLCYVTVPSADVYFELCSRCYGIHVVKPSGLIRLILWRAKCLMGVAAT
jgi:hypothetical protein